LAHGKGYPIKLKVLAQAAESGDNAATALPGEQLALPVKTMLNRPTVAGKNQPLAGQCRAL
jgi:hypothetical protein